MSDHLIKLLATFFYVGDIKKAPGTCASFAAVLLYVVIEPSFLFYLTILLGISALGLIICEAAEGLYKQKDPSNIVIDEVAGMLLACFLLPANFKVLFWAFVLFRFFDITKIYPIKKMEKLKGSVGVMMDDILAGLFTNLIMHVAIAFKIVI